QHFEYEILAPDTINEIFTGLKEIERAVAQAVGPDAAANWLASEEKVDRDIRIDNAENSKREVVLLKPKEAYRLFKRLVRYYAACQLIGEVESDQFYEQMARLTKENLVRHEFENLGGQLVPAHKYQQLLMDIKEERLNSWKEIHARYHHLSKAYVSDKLKHGLAALAEVTNTQPSDWDTLFWQKLFDEALQTKKWICEEIYQSRSKDYSNPFRMIVYNSMEEMEEVVGRIEDNGFINTQQADF